MSRIRTHSPLKRFATFTTIAVTLAACSARSSSTSDAPSPPPLTSASASVPPTGSEKSEKEGGTKPESKGGGGPGGQPVNQRDGDQGLIDGMKDPPRPGDPTTPTPTTTATATAAPTASTIKGVIAPQTGGKSPPKRYDDKHDAPGSAPTTSPSGVIAPQ